MVYASYPVKGGSGGVPTYPTFSAFPASAPNGTLALALDTDILYAYNTGSSSWVAIAGPGNVLSIGSPANGLSITSDTLNLALASTSTTGALSSTDWNTFNNKQPAFTSQTANTFYAAPNGSAGVPSFRTIQSQDVQSVSANLTLNNLTAPTAVSQDLIPVSSLTKFLGSGSLLWGAVYTPTIEAGGNLLGLYGTTGVDVNSKKIINLLTPTASTDAANKGYVDAAISGLTWQGPAQAYAASNVPLTGSTPLVIDGYTVLNGDLLLLGNQTTASQNGEYSASITGGSYILTPNGLPTAVGDAWLVTKGTLYGNSAFTSTSAVPSAAFIEFAGPQALIYTAPLSISGNTVSISQSGTSTNGYLSSTDWNTFNNKQAAGNYITALTGDATASGPGSAALTLATVNSNVGSFGDASHVSAITVNAKGLVTAAASTSIQIAESQVTNLTSDLAGKLSTALTSAHIFVGNGSNVATDTALSGDATLSNTGALTLATVATAGTTGSSTSIPSITINAKGLVTSVTGNAVVAPAGTLTGTTLASNVVSSSLTSVGTIGTGVWNGTTIAIANGGTGQTSASAAFNALSPMTTLGDIIYGGSSPAGAGTRLAGNTTSTKNFLTQTGTGTVSAAPAWGTIAAGDLPTITLTSDVTGSGSGGSIATTVSKIQGTTVSGTTGSGNVVFSASPTLTGTISAAALTLSTALTVANGGTGDASFTAYSVICGGTTSTGALQNVSGVGTSGQVLTSNGPSALPTWQPAGSGSSAVAMQANKGGGSFTANTTVASWSNTNLDTNSAFNSSTGVYTVPVAGSYMASFFCVVGAGNFVSIRKNGTIVMAGAIDTAGNGYVMGIVPSCAVNDTITITIDVSSSFNTSATEQVWSLHLIH